MSGHMPYQLEKGPYFSVTESVLEDISLRIRVLLDMRKPNLTVDQMKTLDSHSLDTNRGPVQTEDQRKDHQNRHWYGKQPLGPGQWGPQPAFNVVTHPRTGFWHNWYGDAEGIVRETYTRAIEVSLGIDHHAFIRQNDEAAFDSISGTHTRAWPIEIFTRCPAPWFEGWVTWHGEGDVGHVSIHIHTPSHDNSNLLKSPVRHAGYNTPEYRDEINFPGFLQSGGARGMWVISHLFHELVASPFIGPVVAGLSEDDPEDPDQKAPWAVPWFGGLVHSQGDIVAVQPSEPNGGVLAGGRPYTP